MARSLAERAIAAAPENPEAWSALATVHEHDGDNPGRARALRGALSCGPRSALAHHGLGRWLAEVGPLPSAIAELELAVEAAPEFTDGLGYLAMTYNLAGDRRATEAIQRGIGLRDGHAMLIGAWKPASKPARSPRSAGAGMGILPPSSLELAVTVPSTTKRREGCRERFRSSSSS